MRGDAGNASCASNRECNAAGQVLCAGAAPQQAPHEHDQEEVKGDAHLLCC
jgi:hypothetical protein